MGLLDDGPKEESAFRTAEQIAQLINEKNRLMAVTWSNRTSDPIEERVIATVVEVNFGEGFVKAVQVVHNSLIQPVEETVTGFMYLVGPFELRMETPEGGGRPSDVCECSTAFAIKHRKRRVTRGRKAST